MAESSQGQQENISNGCLKVLGSGAGPAQSPQTGFTGF